ncbi:hypothetical protein [Amycolatopsis sp. NPDC003731]
MIELLKTVGAFAGFASLGWQVFVWLRQRRRPPGDLRVTLLEIQDALHLAVRVVDDSVFQDEGWHVNIRRIVDYVRRIEDDELRHRLGGVSIMMERLHGAGNLIWDGSSASKEGIQMMQYYIRQSLERVAFLERRV